LAQEGEALVVLVAPQKGDFYESMRPLSRWELLTDILFETQPGCRQQTMAYPRAGGSSNHEVVDLIESQGSTLPAAKPKP
jgi:hypothetical protein